MFSLVFWPACFLHIYIKEAVISETVTFVQHVNLPLATQVSLSECQFESWLICFQFNFLLIMFLPRQWAKYKNAGPCHSLHRTWMEFLALCLDQLCVWGSVHWKVETADGRSLSFSVSLLIRLCLTLCISKKEIEILKVYKLYCFLFRCLHVKLIFIIKSSKN